MREFIHKARIAAAPSQVWAVLADLDNWPEWTPTVTSVERLGSGPVAAGSSVRIIQPKIQPATWHITEWLPDRGFTWVSRSPGMLITAQHILAEHDHGSELTLLLRYQGVIGTLVGLIAGKLTARYLELEASGLKRRSEQVT